MYIDEIIKIIWESYLPFQNCLNVNEFSNYGNKEMVGGVNAYKLVYRRQTRKKIFF